MNAPVNHDHYSDAFLRGILTSVKTIAVVGVSSNAARPSHTVFGYLQKAGYTMVGINPGLAGKTLLGANVYASLADVPLRLDMVDIFRNSEAAGQVVDEILQLETLPKVIWMQLTVRNDEAAARAEAAGIKVVMNRCPKIEHGRLTGTIGFMGVNSGVMSAKPLRPISR
ncbi:MAG: CoA-binding protein [Hyphomicrobiales bacterium]|nr:CoA-binding protein [Hyphomicrobiales bacterium]